MMKIITPLFAAAFLIFSCNNKTADTPAEKDSTKVVQDTPKEITPEPMPDSAAMMKAWKDFKTPGDMHKWMEKTNGTWEADVSVWMDPSAPPEKSKGKIEQSSVLGGRYVTGKYSGLIFGMPTEGITTMAYDNGKKLFISTWIDNQGTGIAMMTGTYDSTTKTLNLRGYQTNPLTGKDSDLREEMTIIDNDSYNLVMYGEGPDGKEMKMMEGLYKRKK